MIVYKGSNPVAVDVMLCYVHVAYVHMAIQDLVVYSHASLGLHVAGSPAILLTFHSVVAPSSMVQTV